MQSSTGNKDDYNMVIIMDGSIQGGEGVLCTGVSHAVNPPVSRLELAGKLSPLLLVLPLQVTDGERDAFLPVGSQASALRGGRGAG